jgi:hypothetical protein
LLSRRTEERKRERAKGSKRNRVEVLKRMRNIQRKKDRKKERRRREEETNKVIFEEVTVCVASL